MKLGGHLGGMLSSASGRAEGTARGEQGVDREDPGPRPPHGVDQPRHRVQHRAEPRDADRDEERVGYGADERDGERVLAADALAQHEQVLGADRDDQRETEGET